MHESPDPGQLQAVADPKPVRREFPRRGSAKVLPGTVVWFCLAALFAFSILGASLVAQEKQSEATPRPDQADQLAAPSVQTLDLSDEVVRDVLTDLQRGIEAHNSDRVLGIFDQQNMRNFTSLRDQISAFFRRYDNVRFRYQLLEVTADKDLGFAIADIDMDADPSDILPSPQRRSLQMRFQMKRGPKGWKVIGLRPADFFDQ